MTLQAVLCRAYSGGQTGADIAFVRVARWFCLPTGGYMPLGWKTLDGPRPEYAALYGMRESSSAAYPPRTFANAGEADLTLRFASNFASAGEVCTLKAVNAAGQSPCDIAWEPGSREPGADTMSAAVAHIRRVREELGRPLRLNCAGNSEKSSPGIERAAMVFAFRLFTALDDTSPCAVCGHCEALHSLGPCGRGETRCKCPAYVRPG